MSNSVEVIFDAANQTDEAFDQLLKDVNRTADNVEKMAKRSNQSLDSLNKKASNVSKSFGNSISVMAGKFLILEHSITNVGRMLEDLVFDFNAKLETAGLGIGSAFLLSGEYIDTTTGKVLEGKEALDAALEDADRMVMKLQASNFQTIATLDQLVRAYQETLPVAMAKGFNRAQVEDFTVAMVQAAGAIGLQLDMLGEETRSILTGAINPRTSRVATVLGLTNEDVAQFRGNTNELFNFLMDKLSAYRQAGEKSQETWAGVWSNSVDIFKQMSAMVSEPLFESIKTDLKDVSDDLVNIDETTGEIEWNDEFLKQVETLQKGIGAIYVLLKGSMGELKDVGSDSFKHWSNLLDSFGTLLDKANEAGVLEKLLRYPKEIMKYVASGGPAGVLIEALQQQDEGGEIRLPMPPRPDTQPKYVQNNQGNNGTDASDIKKSDIFGPTREDWYSLQRDYQGDLDSAALKALRKETKELEANTLSADDAMAEMYVTLGLVDGGFFDLKNSLSLYEDQLKQVEEKQITWQSSLVHGLDELADYYEDSFADRISSAVHGAFDSMEDAMVEFAMTGKASFKDMIDSILSDIMRLVIQQSISSPLASAFSAGLGSIFGSAGGAPVVNTDLASSGSFSLTNNMTLFGQTLHNGGRVVPRFHFGGLAKDEIPAILQTGETVLDREHTQKFDAIAAALQGGGGQGVTIHQHFDMRDYTSEERLKQAVSEAADLGAEGGYQKAVKDVNSRGVIYRGTRG